MRLKIQCEDDWRRLYEGQVVTLNHNPNHLFVVVNIQDIHNGNWMGKDGLVSHPVTLVTTDKNGRPHVLTVTAYAVAYDPSYHP